MILDKGEESRERAGERDERGGNMKQRAADTGRDSRVPVIKMVIRFALILCAMFTLTCEVYRYPSISCFNQCTASKQQHR